MDCSRQYPLPPLLRLTFKPWQNGAAARLYLKRMRERRSDRGRGQECAGPTQAPRANRDAALVFVLTSLVTLPFGRDRSNEPPSPRFMKRTQRFSGWLLDCDLL